MGKSSFVLNYYAANRARWRRKRRRLAIVPLGHPDALDYIMKIDAKRETVLMLDAFDEDAAAIVDYRKRIEDLVRFCAPFQRLLITCRTQFFPRAVEIPHRAGFVYEPRGVGNSGEYEFRKLYLMPFADSQITEYLRLRFRWRLFARHRARVLVKRVPDLSARPMLLAHLPELIKSNLVPATAYELYNILVTQWLEREKRWIAPDTLDVFSEKLALDLHINRSTRGAERLPREEVSILARAWGLQIPTENEWMLTGRSLLNRDSEGRYKFAHRSILEYFLARVAIDRRVNILTLEPTDQVRAFIQDSIEIVLRNHGIPDVLLIAYLFGDTITQARDPDALFCSRLGLLGQLSLDREPRVFVATLMELLAHRRPGHPQPGRLLQMLDAVSTGCVQIPDVASSAARDLVRYWTQLATIDRELPVADAMRLVFNDPMLRLSIEQSGELAISDTTSGLIWSIPITLEQPLGRDVEAMRKRGWHSASWDKTLAAIKSPTVRKATAYEILGLWIAFYREITYFNRMIGATSARELENKIRHLCGLVLTDESYITVRVIARPPSNDSLLHRINETWPELLDGYYSQ